MIKRYFKIRKEAKKAAKEINKKGYGYVKKEIRNLLLEKGYEVAIEPDKNGLYRVETN